MKLLVLLFALTAALPAWHQALAKAPEVSLPLAFQIDAAASPEHGANLARLVDPANTAGVAVGQWMNFDFGKNVAVTELTVVNGWASGQAFTDNGRIRTATLEFSDGSTKTLRFKDTPKPQSLAVSGGGNAVRLVVTAVYPGLKSQTPFLSRVAFRGYDPAQRQQTFFGRFEGCVRSRSSSSWEGGEDQLHYCVRFRADDGKTYGCTDDLCFHPGEMMNVRLKITGVVKEGDVLEVLEAEPAR